MELLKKYATRKYLMYGSIAGGILAVIMLIIYLTAGQGLDSLSGLSSALFSLRSLCVLYYIDFVILVILVGGYAFRIGYLKDASFMGKLLLGCNGAALLMGLFCFSAIRAVLLWQAVISQLRWRIPAVWITRESCSSSWCLHKLQQQESVSISCL